MTKKLVNLKKSLKLVVKKSIPMTGNKCLLDTSIVIHSFRKENQISAKLDTIKEIYVPVIVAGELYFVAYKSSDPVKHLNRTNACLENCILLPTDVRSVEIYEIGRAHV